MALSNSDIVRAEENVKNVNTWAEGGAGTTVTMANGRKVPSPLKIIADAKLFKAPIAWAPGLNVTDATQSYTYLDVVYAPQPTLLPFTTPGTFDPNNWYVIQGVVESELIQTFDTVSDMETSTHLEVGQQVFFNGYYAVNDGGKNSGIVVPAATGTVDGGRFFDIANGVQVQAFTPSSVKQFGVNTSQADNKTALENAINSGLSLDFGDQNDDYILLDQISLAISHGIRWTSNGAKITLNSAGDVNYVINLTTQAGQHQIKGLLQIDANQKAYVGFRIENLLDDLGTISFEDLRIENVYRSGVLYTGGSGLNIKGSWDEVNLVRLFVKDCLLGTGAGIPGIAGIAGLLIEPKSTTPFAALGSLYIESPHIENVTSEDLGYVVDQDGMNIRTASEEALNDTAWISDFTIIGGTFKNCWGRSIKAQTENGNIISCQFIRTTGNLHKGSEIDFQVGSGAIKDIKCLYTGDAPRWVATMSGARTETKNVNNGSVDGVKISLGGGQTIESIVNCAMREQQQKTWSVRDLDSIGGPVQYAVRFTGGTPAVKTALYLSDVTIDNLTEFLVWSGVSDFDDDSRVFIQNAYHFGTPVYLFRANSATSPTVTSKNVYGFIEATEVDQLGSGDVGFFERISSIAPIDVRECGLIKPVSLYLDDGEIGSFPVFGFNTTTGTVILSISRNKNSHGIFCFDSGGVLQLSNEGSQFEVGATTEPVSGDFRLWYDSGLKISNRSGTTRMFTILMLA